MPVFRAVEERSGVAIIRLTVWSVEWSGAQWGGCEQSVPEHTKQPSVRSPGYGRFRVPRSHRRVLSARLAMQMYCSSATPLTPQ